MRITGNSMRRLISFAIIGIVFVCSFAVDYGGHSAKAVPVADDCDWPMFGRTPEGNRVAPDGCGPKTDKLELKWKTGDKPNSELAISNGRVYFGSTDKKLYCLNAENGQKVWEYETGGKFWSSPAISNGKVYVGSWNGKFCCLKIDNGQVVWVYETGMQIQGKTAISNGKVYFRSTNPISLNKLYCLNAENGQKLWEYETGESVYSSPTIINRKVYVGSYDKKLCCLSADDGKKLWECDTTGIMYSSPTISNDKVYVGSYYSKLYCLSADDGKKLWEFDATMIWSSPAISNGRVYFGSTDKKLYCLNAENGQKVWEYETDRLIHSSPAISNGKVYFGSEDKRLYCLNAENGKKVWEYETGDGIFSSPAISNGKVYVGSNDGYLYCFGDAKQEDDDKPMSVSPTSISFGTVDRGKSSLKSINLTFNTTSLLKGTVTCNKRWLDISPTSFDSNAGSLSIICKIDASKLPGKAGEQTANIMIDYYDNFRLNSPNGTRPSGQIVVPITISTEQNIDLDLQVKRPYAFIGKLKVDLGSPPFIKNGRTMVPVRFISESFGCSVEWEPTQKMVTIKRFDEVIIMWEGKNKIIVNGVEKVFDSPPVNSNSRTFVPIRVISEAFNAKLQWFSKEQRLECKYLPPDDGY